MTDLDFDELDRAVNSLIGDTDKSVVDKSITDTNSQAPSVSADTNVHINEEPVGQSVEQNVVEAAPIVVSASSPISTPPTPSITEPQEQVQPQPLAARRSSGRFMDVVHPSSDMRSTNKVASRPTEASDLNTTSEEQVTSPVVTPEELDTHAPVEPEETKTFTSDDQEPTAVSPFLSDAKVEKRPLGAFTDSEKPEPSALNDLLQKELDSDGLSGNDTELAEANEIPNQEAEINQQPKPVNQDEMPEELQGDVLSIETNESESAVVEPEIPEVQPAPTVNAPVAITQQYVEKAQTPQAESGAIFDTDAYHQPVSAGKAHHSGWMTVLWIFLLIILGAGAGVAIYTYVLPLL